MNGGAVKRPARARCVVWHSRHQPPGPALLKALNRPGFRVVKCDNEFAAMAHVSRPTPDDEASVLLLVEPRSLAALGDVASLLERYAARAAVWVFEVAASPRLRAVSEGEVEMWQ